MSSLDLTSNLNEFCFKLFAILSANKDENFFISPLSISTALTMAMTGSATETSKQLKSVLNLQDFTDEKILNMNREYMTVLESGLGNNVALNLANKIFQNQKYEILENFSNNLEKHFNASNQAVNFGDAANSAKLINDWVEDKTEKKIKDLISADILSEETKLVLVNAIYFKGSWNFPFKKEETYKEDFFLKDSTSVKVDMMKLTTKKFHHKMNPAGLMANTCEFTYEGKSTAMTIILPHEGINIEEVESKLNTNVLKEIFENDPMPGPVPIHAYIPKFKLEYKNELSSSLIGLGATHAFDENKADFSLISSDSEGLHISKVIHQAVIDVNEEGTEAAAATAVVMMKRCAMPIFNFPPEEFKCNRPFLFVIHETNHNGILFMGKYMKPSGN